MIEEILEAGVPVEDTMQSEPESDNAPSAPSQEEQKKTHNREQNFAAIRKAAEQAARERDEALRRIQELENKQYVAPKDESQDEDFSIKDDELVEGKHLAKYVKKIKQLEEQQKQYIKQSTESTAEMRLKSQFPDFDKVMTLENVQALSMAYPELAKTINSSNDLYDKASSAYTLIKKFGIYDENPYEADKLKAMANATKPRPSASVSPQQGDSPMQRANAFANGLTPELKEQLRKEMEEARRGY